jgi:spermidine/putrescine-binding protein
MLEKNGKNLDNAHEILEYCDKGGALLKESLAFSSPQKQSDLLKVITYHIRHMESCKKY